MSKWRRLRRYAHTLGDQPGWTSFHFIINTTEVFAQDADTDQLHPAEKKNGDHNRREAGDRAKSDGSKPFVKDALGKVAKVLEEKLK